MANDVGSVDAWLIDNPELTVPADADLLEIVDVSEPGATGLGTTKKIQFQNLNIGTNNTFTAAIANSATGNPPIVSISTGLFPLILQYDVSEGNLLVVNNMPVGDLLLNYTLTIVHDDLPVDYVTPEGLGSDRLSILPAESAYLTSDGNSDATLAFTKTANAKATLTMHASTSADTSGVYLELSMQRNLKGFGFCGLWDTLDYS